MEHCLLLVCVYVSKKIERGMSTLLKRKLIHFAEFSSQIMNS